MRIVSSIVSVGASARLDMSALQQSGCCRYLRLGGGRMVMEGWPGRRGGIG
jgi:hypothetical protein